MTAHRLLVIASLLFVARVAVGKPPRAAEAQRHFDAAVAHYQAHDYALAVGEFESAYRLKPEPTWLYNLAQACRLAHQLDKALDYYRQYLEKNPDAENRPAVEQRIAEVEKAVAAEKSATAAPASGPGAATPPAAEPTAPAAAVAVPTAPSPPPADLPRTPYQLGARLRGIFVTNAMLKPYLQAATSMESWSIGIEFIYRRAKYDVVTSFDVSSIAVNDGNWLGNNQDPMSATHYLQFRGVYLISVDVSLIGHTALGKWLELRYGGGIGVGVVTGDVLDTRNLNGGCSAQTASNLSACNPYSPPLTGQQLEDALKRDAGPDPHRHASPDKWPAAPVVNVLMGLRVKLPKKFTAQFEIGFRDAIFFGAGAHYLF